MKLLNRDRHRFGQVRLLVQVRLPGQHPGHDQRGDVPRTVVLGHVGDDGVADPRRGAQHRLHLHRVHGRAGDLEHVVETAAVPEVPVGVEHAGRDRDGAEAGIGPPDHAGAADARVAFEGGAHLVGQDREPAAAYEVSTGTPYFVWKVSASSADSGAFTISARRRSRTSPPALRS
ncbi:hypothetical protein MXD59_20510 [Frankia sp. Ag45/Mut15]|uniref:Uncharacterized protein n=1 Tax=Frankia umida TaxID=573489 RepID=A0ABT0K325_9ACTN|nr:hypothetical protein [Frankia umida]MCK9878121.1 hypothetical protein [Frankia umida]